MSAVMAYEHKIIDLPRIEYYMDEVGSKHPIERLMEWRSSFYMAFIQILSITFTAIWFCAIVHWDPIRWTFQVTLTFDCYHIQLKYYLWDGLVHLCTVLITGGSP